MSTLRALLASVVLFMTAVIAAAILWSSPSPAAAQLGCPNTDCFGAMYCEFLLNHECHLNGASCAVYACADGGDEDPIQPEG